MSQAGGAGKGPWFKAGLRFACTACGNCCRNHGDGFDYVYSTLRERRAIAAHLGLPQAEFERLYCDDVEGLLSFKSRPLEGGKPGKACIFLEGSRCSIYAHRPLQCRTFPFWPEVLRSPEV
ncbi:MAG TPA: YkgJ family cysteine cluster protein, partial [Planctomycetota bacterium]|nr:YkgJ family cysteine cluster protein [Planctomycetota bacterium]